MTRKRQKIQSFLEGDESKGNNRDPNYPWDLLLKDIKVIKDSLDKKDIWVNNVEIEIINSVNFQRLREIRQLPFADFVYPGATHTRFDHSLGTLHMTKLIVDNINNNSDRWQNCESLDSREIFISRIVGLIHDMAHLSYSHILEDGKLCGKKQWEDNDRIEKYLGVKSDIYQIIQKNIKEAFEECNENNWEEAFKEVIEDIKHTLKVIEGEKGSKSRELIFADIVGNTICADILDYIPRDLSYTGLPGQYDDRILSYFVAKRLNGKRRAVIRLFKGDDYRDSVLSSIMEILELRYNLAAKVYYHHTRRKAVAMAVEMVAAACKAGIVNKTHLLELGGISLRDYILGIDESKINEEEKIKSLRMAKKLANHIKNRWLYEKLCDIEIVATEARGLIEEMQNDWEKRYKNERKMEELFELEPGSILIYAPSKFMAAKKTLETLVEVPVEIAGDANVKSLEELEENDFREENKDNYKVLNMNKEILITKHKLLWKLSVFVHKDISEETRIKIKNLCDQWFKGMAPVTAVEALSESLGMTIKPTVCTEIAEGIKDIVASHPSKTIFIGALDVAKSRLEEYSGKDEKRSK